MMGMRVGRGALAIALCAGALLLAACGSPPVRPRTVGPAGAERSVLIAYRATEFKKAVVGTAGERLSADGYRARLIDVDDLPEAEADAYDAIVVVDRCWTLSLSGPAEDFLEQSPAADRTVLVVTSNGGDWRPGEPDVDAVTAASRMADADDVAAEVVARVSVVTARAR